MTKAEIKSLLQENGYRVTAGRVAILEQLEKAKQPMTIAEIAAVPALKSLDQVTLYRALESFVQKGIARQIQFQGRAQYYELAHDHHHHIVCTDCGIVKDIDACAFDAMFKKATPASLGFSAITNHSFEIFGRCVNCATLC